MQIFAIMAVLSVVGDLVQFRELFSATGYNSADDRGLLFRLGQHDELEIVEVTWPD